MGQDAEIIRAARAGARALRSLQKELEDLLKIKKRMARGTWTQGDTHAYLAERLERLTKGSMTLKADGDTEEALAKVLESLVSNYEEASKQDRRFGNVFHMTLMLPANNPFRGDIP